MAKLYESALSFPNFFSIDTTNPIDDRFVVERESDLTLASVLKYPYVGMVVNVQNTLESDAEMWVLIKLPATKKENWRKISTENRLRGVQSYLDTRIYGTQTQLDGVQSAHEDWLKGVQTVHEDWLKGIQDDLSGVQTQFKGVQNVHETWLKGIQDDLSGVQTQLTNSNSGLQSMIDDCRSMCGAQHVSIWNAIDDITPTQDYKITFVDESGTVVGYSNNISNATW